MEAEVKEEESKVDKLVAHVIECAEARFDLVAIEVQEKVSDILASMASIVVIGLLITVMALLLSIGAARYLCEYFRSAWIGYVYVAGVYLVLIFGVYFTRRRLIKLPIINNILKRINFNEED